MINKFGLLLPGLISILVTAIFSLDLKHANATAQVGQKTLVLYDAASGAIPATQLMNFIDFPPGAAAPTYNNGGTILDTTTSGSDTYAGWVSTAGSAPGFPLLDQVTGFQVNFSLQVENESHSNHNRAGFSMIILSQDTKGIELAFWENEIWAQNDNATGGLFTHGEGSIVNTTGFANYQVTISTDTYTLIANSTPILTGPLRDYNSFEGFPDPYQTPNFLFIGDNTTSAQARIRLGYVSVTGTESTSSAPTSVPTSTISPTAPPTLIPPTTTPTPASGGWEFCPLLPSALAFSIMWIKSNRAKRDRL